MRGLVLTLSHDHVELKRIYLRALANLNHPGYLHRRGKPYIATI
jgi:hypothetical protein